MAITETTILVPYLNGLVQERCNSIANALELRFSYTNPWISKSSFCNSFEEQAPVDEIYLGAYHQTRCRLDPMTRYHVSRPSNGSQATCPTGTSCSGSLVETTFVVPYHLLKSLRLVWSSGAITIKRLFFPGMGIPALKIRWSCDCLIFNMGIPIPGKNGLYIETGPWSSKESHKDRNKMKGCQ